MYRIIRIIDIINEWSGKIFSWLFLPLTFIVVSEVIMRYIFNDPIIGVWDISGIIQALIVVFGGGYAMLHKSHV